MAFKFHQNIIIKFSAQLFKILPFLITNFLLANLLLPEKKGEYEILILLGNMLYFLFNLGLPSGNIYFIARYPGLEKKIFGNTLLLNLLITIVISFFAYWLMPLIVQQYYKGINLDLARIMIFTLFFNLCYQSLIKFFEGQKDFIKSSFFELLYSYLWFIFLLMLYLFKVASLNLIIYFWIMAIGVTALLLIIYLFNKYGFVFSFSLFKQQLSYGLKVYITGIIIIINYKIDLLMLGSIAGMYYAGIYSIAVFGAEILLRPVHYISSVLYPTVSGNTEAQNNQFTPLVCRLTFWLSMVCGLFAVLLAGFFLKLFFDPSYQVSLTAFFIIVPGIVFFSIGKILSVDLTGRGKPTLNIIIYSFIIIFNLVCNYLLIPVFKEKGSAVSTSVSYILSTVGFMILFKIKYQFKFSDLLVIKKTDIEYLKTIIDSIKQKVRPRRTH